MSVMNRQHIEAWALNVYDTVASGAKVEDSLVELKSEWPDPPKAASAAPPYSSRRLYAATDRNSQCSDAWQSA